MDPYPCHVGDRMDSSPPPGVESVSMTIGLQGPSPNGIPHPVHIYTMKCLNSLTIDVQ
ncbi:hypothetical protein F2Q68_00009037 [Brassica cretica]|uniref:Uncharacterized protein n=1 Tax=Brassica cretica TaxID=69181 RepID=A0A8S9L4D4_BRACR|nr:hypothetical protein F2Q68_00009037 [Brassica cretica]